MKQTVNLVNQNLWCPQCATGYLALLQITLEAAPGVDADVTLTFVCQDCFKHLAIDFSELETGESDLSLAEIMIIAQKRGLR